MILDFEVEFMKCEHRDHILSFVAHQDSWPIHRVHQTLNQTAMYTTNGKFASFAHFWPITQLRGDGTYFTQRKWSMHVTICYRLLHSCICEYLSESPTMIGNCTTAGFRLKDQPWKSGYTQSNNPSDNMHKCQILVAMNDIWCTQKRRIPSP